MDTGLTSDYIATVQEEADTVARYMVDGKCKSYEEYKEKVGHIKGLRKSIVVLHETIQHMMDVQNLEDDDAP